MEKNTSSKRTQLLRRGAEQLEILRKQLGGEITVTAVFHENNVPKALIEEITAMLDTTSELMRVRFFMTPYEDLGGNTPADAMRQNKDLNRVRLLAAQYLQQGAR